MKILLTAVNAKYIHSNLAIRLLKAYAEPAVPGIRIREFTINQRQEDVLADICQEQPDVLLFSCYIWNICYIRDLLQDIALVLPSVHIWLGGPEVSFDPEQVLSEHPCVKGILLGEGEAVFRDLMESHYLHGRSLSQIAGICYRRDERASEDGCPEEGNSVADNGRRETAGGLSESAFVRTGPRDLLPMDEVPFVYTDALMKELEHRIVYYESSRGCPFGCAYCLSSVDKTVRFRSLELVFRELQFFLDHQVPQVKFVDRTFNIDPARTVQILAFLQEHDNGITNFHFEIAGDLLTEEQIGIMASMRPGLVQLEIGVQSTNPETLRAIYRKTDLDTLRRHVLAIHSLHNIHQHLDLIAGLPYETYDRFAESFCDVYAMQPDQLQLGFLKLLKGSPMEQQAAAYGIVCQKHAPYEVLHTRWLSYPQIRRLKQVEEMVELYYNSRQFIRTLQVLERCFANAFSMFEELALYYDRRGFFVQSPSRQYRYEILLSFALVHDPGKEEWYRELLTFDLYLRENLKSRPAFAKDLRPYRRQIRTIREEKGLSATDRSVHVEPFFYPVWEGMPGEMKPPGRELPMGRKLDTGPVMILFDYRKRDPLDHNAQVLQLL